MPRIKVRVICDREFDITDEQLAELERQNEDPDCEWETTERYLHDLGKQAGGLKGVYQVASDETDSWGKV